MQDLLICVRAGSAALIALLLISGSQAQPTASIPNFAPDDHTSWHPDRPDGDNFLSPESGPGPVVSRPGFPYVPNGDENDFAGTNPTYRVADLTNPILQPWVTAQMARDNDEVIAGKIPFTARERCFPGGVPAWAIFRRVAPPMHFFIQTPQKVLLIWRGDNQVRHVYLNEPHSRDVKPSWYGESVGHYENGDTLVIDTIGLDDRTHVDLFRTPHSAGLHVIERWKLIEGGREIELNVYVEDPGAFRAPYELNKHYRRVEAQWLEVICAENPIGPLEQGLEPMPQSNQPDF